MAEQKNYVLAIDQGTTSSRAILFDADYAVVSIGQSEFVQFFPHSGWVEHDPEEIWSSILECCHSAIAQVRATPDQIVAIGITNQRETTIVWDRKTGKPIYNAIVWQDRRTAETCQQLKNLGHEAKISEKTGLLLDPYFSATKIAWILDNVVGVREKAEAGQLLFGTVDSYLLWRLTNGMTHATDATNASRTMLYNIHQGCWDDDLLALFDIPRAMLPDVRDSAADFGQTDNDIFGKPIPITSLIGDQQSALVGQACFEPGMVKSTYGTGCFVLLNTGTKAVTSKNKLLTTIALQLNNTPTYALEGSIFIAGAAVQWLRDGLKIIDSAPQSEELATKADDEQDIYLVPAFVGLGAPYWDADCRGAIYGLTRNTGPAEISKAALEAVCYQTSDLLQAMADDWKNGTTSVVRVDGGMATSDWTMQRLSDILAMPIDRPPVLETTALGAAYLSGMQVGFYPSPEGFSKSWKKEKRFTSTMSANLRKQKLCGWKDAIRRTLSSS
ncbi:MAG: glycerol kinase GlpK [Gammaproteobacteria bacterium]|nr:glycerol kinase GlpK [Gammaproteobacteria bacterium]